MSKRFLLIFGLIILCFQSAIAQKLQFGVLVKASAPQLFFAKNPDKNTFKYLPSISSGIGAGGNYYFNKKLNLYSGFNLQLKSYAVRLYNFRVENVEGFISHRPLFASMEMPIIINYEKKRKKENAYINYGVGTVLSFTKPLMTTVRQKGPLFSEIPERDTLISSFNSNLNKTLYFSYDLYLGIKFVKKIKQRRLYEWGVSYQHALKKSSELLVMGQVQTLNENKYYNSVFNPKLSSIVIHFIFYPKSFIVL